MNNASESLPDARRRFFHLGQVPRNLVAEPILRSWDRCARSGLDAEARPSLEPLTAAALRARQERHELLRRISRPELESLRVEAGGTGSVVILAEAGGLILDSLGDAGFAARAAQVSLQPGVAWDEGRCGTNAIGTAIVERRPTVVHGGEHFFAAQGFLSCAAVPLLDPRGELLGVLDLTGHAEVPHLHALGLVRLAADQIEHRQFEEGFEDCDVLRFHRDRALLGTAREGVLVFRGDRLVAANRHGLALVGLRWGALGMRRIGEIFADRPEPGRAETRLRTYTGEEVRGTMSAPRPRASRGAASAQPVVALPTLREVTPQFGREELAALGRAQRLIAAGLPVLVQGETGTGKEMFARALHGRSSWRSGPFVAVNCAALPETLIEAELFGYEAGAYTGARRTGSRGLVREADGGVLFLDEIGDMPLSLQARLLRVLQDREVRPLGGGQAVPVSFALVCATHRDLRAMVAAGQFRADLYFRIAQQVVQLRPLRAVGDLGEVVDAVWRELGAEQVEVTLADETRARLLRHDWPGNFRELVGALRGLLALAEPQSRVGPELLSPEIGVAAPVVSAGERSLAEIQRAAMQATLESCGGNVSAAARQLGIDRATFYRRLGKSSRRNA